MLVNRLLAATLLLLVAAGSWAQEETEAEQSTIPPSAIYIPLKPSFVVNYGGPGKLRYIKADITLRVQDTTTANQVRHHLPYLRNNLVLLLSKQTDESIDTQQGKEILRQAALAEMHAVLEEEEGSSGIIDLYFDNFIIQR
ncbi:flagellar basal body-associated FliL family protein [Halioxenophilus sp. WMMB6]|uniref:flagellar basal body-associated FliL family protein n=1 Tax=Halioxenophilus sp. WMMB6 TaxID=3073815 RepID=UPI00295EBB4C|nr:flagellar basal body-associated FliL family protein [Halioxenophilus sp. WMMB6]